MKRRKRLILLAAAMILMLLATTGAFALFRETDINYYYEDSYLYLVGEYYVDCDGNVTQWGITSQPFRVYDQYSCSTGQRVVHRCQESDGTSWINITCPANQ